MINHFSISMAERMAINDSNFIPYSLCPYTFSIYLIILIVSIHVSFISHILFNPLSCCRCLAFVKFALKKLINQKTFRINSNNNHSKWPSYQ